MPNEQNWMWNKEDERQKKVNFNESFFAIMCKLTHINGLVYFQLSFNKLFL